MISAQAAYKKLAGRVLETHDVTWKVSLTKYRVQLKAEQALEIYRPTHTVHIKNLYYILLYRLNII
jgi:hypothetical protein